MSVKLKHISILPPLMLWNVWAPNCYINRIRRNSLTVIKLTILAQGSDTSIGMKLSWNIDSHFQLSTVLVFCQIMPIMLMKWAKKLWVDTTTGFNCHPLSRSWRKNQIAGGTDLDKLEKNLCFVSEKNWFEPINFQ